MDVFVQIEYYKRIKMLEEALASVKRVVCQGLRAQAMRGDRSSSDVFMMVLKTSDKIADICTVALEK